MNINVTINSSLNLNAADMERVIQKELEKSAYQIELQGKANCPVLTGYLRDSIEAEIDNLEVNIGTECDYAHFVHDGTYKMEARPFLESAAETVLDNIEDRIADAIERVL
jgi:HK97 gp10 family phage protein